METPSDLFPGLSIVKVDRVSKEGLIIDERLHLRRLTTHHGWEGRQHTGATTR